MYYLKSLVLITRVVFYTFRFPCIRESFINEKIAHPTTPPEELVELLHVSDRNPGLVFLFIIPYTAYFIKEAYIIYRVLAFYDHYEPENNIKKIDDSIYEFTCIRTNCTDLVGPNPKLMAISKIPVFAICNPRLTSFYTPILHIDAVGLLAFTVSAFGVLLIGTIMPLQQILFPANLEPLMFMIAPKSALRLTAEKISKIVHEITNSYKNYIPVPKDWCLSDYVDKKYYAHSGTSGVLAGKTLAMNQYSKPAIEQPGRMENFQDDCPPATRTEWWRLKLSWLLFVYDFFCVTTLSIAAAVVLYYIQSNIIAKYDKLAETSMTIRRIGCAIWRVDLYENSSDELRENRKTVVDLEMVASKYLRWNAYSLPETSIINIWPLISVFLISGYYFCSILDLNCWLAELHYQLLFALDMSKFDLARQQKRRSYDGSLLGEQKLKKRNFDLEVLRKNFIESADMRFILLIRVHKLTQIDFPTFRERQIFLARLVAEEGYGRESLVELLEKIYVNLRQFNRYVRHLAPIMAVLIVATYIINYSLVIIALWYSRNFKNFFVEPLTVGAIGWVISNSFIFFAANFHASVSILSAWLIKFALSCLTNNLNVRNYSIAGEESSTTCMVNHCSNDSKR